MKLNCIVYHVFPNIGLVEHKRLSEWTLNGVDYILLHNFVKEGKSTRKMFFSDDFNYLSCTVVFMIDFNF